MTGLSGTSLGLTLTGPGSTLYRPTLPALSDMASVGSALVSLLASLLAAGGLATAVQYSVVSGRHPSTPLLQVSAPSRITCSLHCLHRSGCNSWRFTPPRQCSLFPALAEDPAAPTAAGAVWASTWIPEGYNMMPGTTKAFRVHSEKKIQALEIPEACAEDHDKAAPGFLQNEEQIMFARGILTTLGYPVSTGVTPNLAGVWTGVKETDTDKVYGDFTGTRLVTLKPSWIAPGYTFEEGLPCVRMFQQGLDLNPCLDHHGFLCEYELL